MGGAALIATAIAVFVVLVSAQVFKDWPIAALGGNDDSAAVSKAEPAAGSEPAAAITTVAGAARGVGKGQADRANAVTAGNAGSLASNGVTDAGAESVTPDTGAAATPGDSARGGDGSAGGDQQQSPSPSSPSGGNASGGGAVSSGGGKAASGTGGSSGSAGSTTGQVTETVNNTVNGVDESVLGGTLDNTGVTGVTEGVVNGVVGPESPVGKVVDETVGAVGGLLHGNR
jgi:hypothetical protein